MAWNAFSAFSAGVPCQIGLRISSSQGATTAGPSCVGEGTGRLLGPDERRHVELVVGLEREPVGEELGLAPAACGQRRVVDGEAVAHPLGLRMADEGDLHGPGGYGLGLAVAPG